MRRASSYYLPLLLLAPLCLTGSGCSGTDEVLDLAGVLPNLGGTWNYQIDNPDQATFVNCTGDAAVLEGRTWNEALALAPICHVGSSFQVTQNVGTLLVVPHNVTCSDGSTAVISGVGIVTSDSASGQWNGASDQNVNSTQNFDGSVAGNVVTLTEDARDFSGAFQGSCDISPALAATVTVQ